MAKPVHERILVKPDQVEKSTAGGILIPKESQKRPQMGTVRRIEQLGGNPNSFTGTPDTTFDDVRRPEFLANSSYVN